MIGDVKVFALLTIREGSKRISDKAFRTLAGHPMIHWAIDACKKSSYIDDIYVSTSSQLYKRRLNYWDVKIIDRPDGLSQDNVPVFETVKHANTVIEGIGTDYIIHVDFSKPLTSVDLIDDCITYMYDVKLDSLFTVKKVKHFYVKTPMDIVNSQDLPDRIIRFSAVRLRTKKAIHEATKGDIWGFGRKHKDFAVINDYEIDVDKPWQFICAEALIKAGYGG